MRSAGAVGGSLISTPATGARLPFVLCTGALAVIISLVALIDRWQRILLLAAAVLALGAVGRYLLVRYSDSAGIEEAPLQRIPRNAPYITSPEHVIDEMIKLADISSRDLVYDLGCGDGRIVVRAAVQRGCRGIGYDIDPQRVAEAIANVQQHKVEHLVEIQQRDVFTLDLSEADVVLMYLLPWMLEKLVPQLEACRPGTRIVSHDFQIAGIQEEQTVHLDLAGERKHLHLYVTPLKRSAIQPKWKNWKDQ
jgi:SAM-dependent methyltransferase